MQLPVALVQHPVPHVAVHATGGGGGVGAADDVGGDGGDAGGEAGFFFFFFFFFSALTESFSAGRCARRDPPWLRLFVLPSTVPARLSVAATPRMNPGSPRRPKLV